MIDLSKPTPLPDAVAAFDARTPVGTALRSAEIESLPLDARRRAFFMARVENTRYLEQAKKELQRNVKQLGTNRDRATFIANMQKTAHDLGIPGTVAPKDRGGLKDPASARRLGLVFDMQTSMAKGEASYRSSMDPDVLNARPAQELIRVESRKEKRDWPAIWKANGGEFFGPDDRMVALITDPIWFKISRFGVPWPPFDWGSGMGLKGVRRRDAVELGLLKRGERLEPEIPAELNRVETSLAGMSDDAIADLELAFGDLAQRTGDNGGFRFSLKEDALTEFLNPTLEDDAYDAVFDLGNSPAVGKGEQIELRSSDAREAMKSKRAAKFSDWNQLPAVLWMPDDVIDEPDAGTGKVRRYVYKGIEGDRSGGIWELILGQAEGRDGIWRVLEFLRG